MRELRLTEYFANENDITFHEETNSIVENAGTLHHPPQKSK